uniref:THO complex subunit 2 n=1 Tax=Erigeron canadensis TaxID=72917 RepID=UPI001CB93AC8|nr:THO complex subunit 2 [Erigeron canadensis]
MSSSGGGGMVECRYITQECIREWKNGNNSFKPPSPPLLLRFQYELSWNIVKGELPINKCKSALELVDCSDNNDEVASNFADIVSQMALDHTMPGEYRARLIKLAKWMVEHSVVPLRLFHERCEEEFLWDSEMIKIKAADLKSKEVRVNTRLLYQQTKFNLLREESEGYAKLVTLLCQGSEDRSQNTSAATVGIIKSLIGHFNLDPNRVFDIVLECFELQPDNNAFLNLIPIFPKSNASQILGFKFQYYQRMEVHNTVPFGLYQLTAILVKNEFIDLDSIYTHLLPNDDEAIEHYNVFSAKRLDEANKIGKINLAATGKDLMDDEKQGDVTVDLFAALEMEREAVIERSSELENSQTLGLLIGFLFVDDWHHANILFRRLSPLNPVEHIQICDGLFRIIEKTISPAYELVRHSPLQATGDSDFMETDNNLIRRLFIDLPKELFEMLTSVGPYLHRDTLLLQKVCRVLRGYYLSALKSVTSGDGSNSDTGLSGNRTPRFHLKEARLNLEEAFGACLLPSLQMIPANPAVGQEIWAVLSLLPYEARYRLYGEWEKDDECSPMVQSAKQTAKLDTRRILKRLAKENLKQLGRMVAKLAHANPMTVLRTIVHQIEAYRDMIAPVVDAFKYLTQLEYDILEYVVIERLVQSGREKLKDDGLNLSDWLQSLASFWGHLCKKYPSMELRGLFQYLVNQLKKGSGIELVLLQELIQQMANVQYTENMTEEQLDAMAGSETLRYQATSFGATRNNKALIKSTNRLRDSLLPKDEPKLAIPLLLLIAQHRSVVVIEADSPHIKMVCEQLDRCHGSLLQYVEFLCGAMTPIISYAQLVPRLHDLIHLYHLEPEVAFLIYRPVMRLFRCQSSPDVLWPLDCDELTSSSAAEDSESMDISGKLILDLGPSQKPIMWSDLLDTVRTVLPSKAWNSLSPDLYATFWGLTLYDLYVPRSRYESEIAKQHAALKALEELSDNSNSAITKRKKDKERIQESLDRLTSELRKHEANVASVRRRLAREKDKWLSSCPDTLKINMEFLQRCIFPRCTFSMPDAVYCAMFVHTLHSLGTPFFNTVNHIDVLICKTLQPMICCCTEYEVGRLGRFLFETLKMAYYWKSDESVYERECGNMPGFAVYYRYPNSQRVTYSQFIKVHWKWSQRITRLLIHCLESTEYMEIRNALILLTKVSNAFPVTRKSGINLEKRVAKLKSDEREDLKVLATGVAAALAARKPSWVTEEEFGMGYLDLKSASSTASKSAPSTSGPPSEAVSGRSTSVVHHHDSIREPTVRAKPSESKHEKGKGSSLSNGSDPSLQSGPSKSAESQKQTDDSGSRVFDENPAKGATLKRSVLAASVSKQAKQDLAKNEPKPKTVGRISSSAAGEQAVALHEPSIKGPTLLTRSSETDTGMSKMAESRITSIKDESSEAVDVQRRPSSRPSHSPRHDNTSVSKSNDKAAKRTSPAEEQERFVKRRKGEHDLRDIEPEVRFSDRERSLDPRASEKYYQIEDDPVKSNDKSLDKSKNERYDREYRERFHGDDVTEKSRDRSMERYSRERSVDRTSDKSKDDRNKGRYNETSVEKSHVDDRFRGQSLPPPPPLPPHVVPQSLNANRRDEDSDRRVGTSRHSQRLSPKHDDREHRRSEENMLISQEEAKRRREEEIRERKREEREGFAAKMDDRERDGEREKGNLLKEESDVNASKRRKLKREHLPLESGEYSPVAPAPPLLNINMTPSYDVRDRGDRKAAVLARPAYVEESNRMHGKDVPTKMTRRDSDPMYDREWEDEKRQRVEPKRRHRK